MIPSEIALSARAICSGVLSDNAAWSPLPSDGEEGRGRLEEEPGTGALWRLSRLPAELQEAVIRYLPLKDVLVWQRLNRNFAHRVRVAGLLEQAFCRSLGRSWPLGGLSRAHYNSLLRPWQAGFPASQQEADSGPGFRPERLFYGISRTLTASARCVVQEVGHFLLEEHCTSEPAVFSPDGRHLTVRARAFIPGCLVLTPFPVHIFTWDTGAWHQGSPFTSRSEICCICFASNGQRVAVMEDLTELLIWERRPSVDWHQTARFVVPPPLCRYALSMVFSPDSRSLALQALDAVQYVWSLDAREHWQPGGTFSLGTIRRGHQDTAFSPDSRWLLLHCDNERFVPCSHNRDGRWWPHPPLHPAGQPCRARHARFRPDSRSLYQALEDSSLSVWQLCQGQWCETTRIRHPDGIADLAFSPDGRQLVTFSAPVSGAVLWEEDSGGNWVQRHGLCRPDPGTGDYRVSVRFDPRGRWLIVFRDARDFDTAPDIWKKNARGLWSRCTVPFLSAGPARLAAAADGQHLVVMSRDAPWSRRSPTGRCRLMLLGFERQRGAWAVKNCERALVECHAVTVDPFCCHLAISLSSPAGVLFLRVQPAPVP